MSSSLWLIPPADDPFTKSVQELISETVPGNFPRALETHNFVPHVTLTSDIDPKTTYEKSSSSQEWLDSLSLPDFKKNSNEVVVELDELSAGEPFFKKVFIRALKNENLDKLAATCRQEAVLNSSADKEKESQSWAKDEYDPHMSLMYADLPLKEAKAKVPLVESQVGWGLGSLFSCCGGSFCFGGKLVLVDTSKEISEWKTIAERDAPWATWAMTRNLA